MMSRKTLAVAGEVSEDWWLLSDRSWLDLERYLELRLNEKKRPLRLKFSGLRCLFIGVIWKRCR